MKRTTRILPMKLNPLSAIPLLEADISPQTIRKAAAPYGIRCHIVGVRKAREQFSRILNQAASGDAIVVTANGRPKAMIVRFRPIITGRKWISLESLRQTMPMGPDSGPLLHEIRADRY